MSLFLETCLNKCRFKSRTIQKMSKQTIWTNRINHINQLETRVANTAHPKSHSMSTMSLPKSVAALCLSTYDLSNRIRRFSSTNSMASDVEQINNTHPTINTSAINMITISQMKDKRKLLDGSIVSIKKDQNDSTRIASQSSSIDAATRQEKLNYQSMNFVAAINNALQIAMRTDETAIVFGQDVAFGGVFRASNGLQEEFGKQRVFNTPISEGGIAGLAIGYAATFGGTAIGEIQFADYIYPALDQLVNELAKFRYRSGNQWNAGGVTIRTPCGAVGHGGHYHSQSPEAYLAHTAGLVTVMPSTPITAKGLLLASIRSPDPVIFLEPKILYRTAIEDVPIDDYEIPLGKARIVQEGTDVTVIGWGGQVRVLQTACDFVKEQHNISCELIDLQTIVPMDTETLVQSVTKTGRCIVSHEAPVTCGYGAEIVATIQEQCFWNLLSPIQRVCGYDIPFPLITEKLYVPDYRKNIQAILKVIEESK